MGIFTRFKDIVTSNINAILDLAEDPEKMVRLMIQEMEDTLVEVKSNCARFIAEQKRVERALDECRAETGRWAEKAELALRKGREDLARSALAEKRRFTERVDHLSDELQRLKEIVVHFQGDIAQLEQKLVDARERQRSIIQRRAAVGVRRQAQDRIRRVDTTDAFTKFEAYENNIDRLEAETHLVNGLRPDKSLHERFAELEHEDEIAQELSELKQKVRPGEPK